jgi:PEP-CTERM motif-containing protein
MFAYRKFYKKLLAVTFGTLALATAIGSAQATTFASVTVDGAIYSLSESGNLWTLLVDDSSYNFKGTGLLDQVAIKVSSAVTAATLTVSPAGWGTSVSLNTTINNGNGGGCGTGGSGFVCSDSTGSGLTTSGVGGPKYTFTFDITPTGSFFDGINDLPTIKARYDLATCPLNGSCKVGSIVSEPVAVIPEPEIYAMMGIGLVLMGFVARRRRQQAAAV